MLSTPEYIIHRLPRARMENNTMAGLNSTNSETSSHISMYTLLVPWQLVIVGAIIISVLIAMITAPAKHFRALVQPFVLRHVESGVPVILAIQKYRHPWLDSFFGVIATVVSVPFYSLVLPLFFWHGQPKLGRQLTLIIATCVYVGNSAKDLVCAQRPPPPVCRVVSSESEAKGSEEYGLPSSHSINTICFAGYVLYYLTGQNIELSTLVITTALLTTLVSLVIFGRLYLGMHSPIDIAAGCAIGATLLLVWCNINEYLDGFVTGGKNVVIFWTTIAILGLHAYPTPESPTPSFEDHTAFSGVALGVVSGVHRTFLLFHSGVLSPASLTLAHIGMKTALGMATAFTAKEGCKYLAKLSLPLICYVPELLLGFRFHSSSYVKSMKKEIQDDLEAPKLCGAIEPCYRVHGSVDIDTGIRFVQYAALGWAVVELAPRIFFLLGL